MKNTNSILALALLALSLAFVGCSDLKTDLPSPVAPGVQAHRAEWIDTSSASFHGKVIRAANGDVQECLKCHGQNYQGGTSGVSCVTCHQTKGASLHGRGWTDPSSPNFHGNTIRSANWDMRPCQTCHGVLYDGGKVGVSCRDCHRNGAGPENCALCHGSGNNIAPPRDLSKNTSPSARGVGAHQVHLLGSSIAGVIACGECHVVPGSAYESGHIDSSPGAELTFGAFSRFPTGNGTVIPNPSYNSSTIRCNNTFCHGNFTARRGDANSVDRFAYTDTSANAVMTGANYAPLWNGGATEATCKTCHRSIFLAPPAPPDTSAVPIGHVGPLALSTCGGSGCHPQVVNSSGQIIDNTKHMNGKVNVRNTERSF